MMSRVQLTKIEKETEEAQAMLPREQAMLPIEQLSTVEEETEGAQAMLPIEQLRTVEEETEGAQAMLPIEQLSTVEEETEGAQVEFDTASSSENSPEELQSKMDLPSTSQIIERNLMALMHYMQVQEQNENQQVFCNEDDQRSWNSVRMGSVGLPVFHISQINDLDDPVKRQFMLPNFHIYLCKALEKLPYAEPPPKTAGESSDSSSTTMSPEEMYTRGGIYSAFHRDLCFRLRRIKDERKWLVNKGKKKFYDYFTPEYDQYGLPLTLERDLYINEWVNGLDDKIPPKPYGEDDLIEIREDDGEGYDEYYVEDIDEEGFDEGDDEEEDYEEDDGYAAGRVAYLGTKRINGSVPALDEQHDDEDLV